MVKLTTTSNFFLFRWLSTFTSALLSSLTDLNYYVSILNSPVKFSLKIIGWFYLCVGLLLTIIFTVKTLPQFNNSINDAREQLVREYPDNLSFEWDGETLHSTLTEPMEVDYPKAFPPNPDAPKKLLRIDTTSEKNPDNYQALIYINQKNVFVNSYQGEWTQAPLNGVLNDSPLRYDRNKILELAQSSRQTQQEILGVMPWFAFVGFSLGLFILRVFNTLIDALILQFFFQLIRKPIAYKKVFQLCLHLLIPVELITQFSHLIAPNLDFPMFSLSFWLLSALLLWHLRNLHIFRLEKKTE